MVPQPATGYRNHSGGPTYILQSSVFLGGFVGVHGLCVNTILLLHLGSTGEVHLINHHLTIKHMISINQIFETSGNYSQVSVDRATFDQLRGLTPAIGKYETTRDAKGNGIRVFNVDGTKVYTKYNKEDRKTAFIMLTADAEKHLRANQEAVEFDF